MMYQNQNLCVPLLTLMMGDRKERYYCQIADEICGLSLNSNFLRGWTKWRRTCGIIRAIRNLKICKRRFSSEPPWESEGPRFNSSGGTQITNYQRYTWHNNKKIRSVMNIIDLKHSSNKRTGRRTWNMKPLKKWCLHVTFTVPRI